MIVSVCICVAVVFSLAHDGRHTVKHHEPGMVHVNHFIHMIYTRDVYTQIPLCMCGDIEKYANQIHFLVCRARPQPTMKHTNLYVYVHFVYTIHITLYILRTVQSVAGTHLLMRAFS